MDRDPYEFEPPIGTPAEHRARRAYLFKAYEGVPVPPGVEDLPDDTKRAPHEAVGPDGSILKYYIDDHGDHYRIYATLDHPEGYAEFILIDDQWRYLAAPKVVYSGLTSFWPDQYEAAKVTVDPPTLALANELAAKHPDLVERDKQRERLERFKSQKTI